MKQVCLKALDFIQAYVSAKDFTGTVKLITIQSVTFTFDLSKVRPEKIDELFSRIEEFQNLFGFNLEVEGLNNLYNSRKGSINVTVKVP
jgi:hypothetical protein